MRARSVIVGVCFTLLGAGITLGVIGGFMGEGWTSAAMGLGGLALADGAWTSLTSPHPFAPRRRMVSLGVLCLSLIVLVAVFPSTPHWQGRMGLVLMGVAVLASLIVLAIDIPRRSKA